MRARVNWAVLGKMTATLVVHSGLTRLTCSCDKIEIV